MPSADPTYDVIVIGGGAAGMLAAGQAGALGKRVLLIEKNERLGAKLSISGGGRCNITHDERDLRTLLKSYGASEQFLYSSFAQFGVTETVQFFESLGVPLVTEARNRMFPASSRAEDVVDALRTYMHTHGVVVLTKTPVTGITTRGGAIHNIQAGGRAYTAASYILATGGLSHPETGSTGEGMDWLRTLGHTIAAPTPTIVPLRAREAWVKSLRGTTLPQVKITFSHSPHGAHPKMRSVSKTGDILCTHFGISGPMILNVSGVVADMLATGDVTARIDLFPQMDEGMLDAHILTACDASPHKLMRNLLRDIVPPGTSEALLSLVPVIDPEQKANSLTREQRIQLRTICKHLPLTITSLLGFDSAVVADGGVPLTEIDTRTMRSRIVPNLFITGDLLHIRRPTGGYSLQLCWTTGYVAGMNA